MYLPCDDKRVITNEEYLETLNELQGLVDSCPTPFFVVGDFNTKLPQSPVLPSRWSRAYPKRSRLLYNFIADNDCYVTNFDFPQSTNYTWRRGPQKSYIDHIIASTDLREQVACSKILADCADNASDHLAVTCVLQLQLSKNREPGSSEPVLALPQNPKPQWDDPAMCTRYKQSLTNRLLSISVPDFARPMESSEAASFVNTMASAIVNSMHAAVEDATVLPNNQPSTQRARQRAWWTTDCTAARDRSRLFHRIWKSMGCPPQGTTYECYKEARKAYRRVCRQAVGNRTNQKHRALSELFQTHRAGQFWNAIRRLRQSQFDTDAIDISLLHAYFKEKFSTSNLVDATMDPNSAQEHFNNIKSTPMNRIVISEARVIRLIKNLRGKCSPGLDGISAEHLKNALGTMLPLVISVILTLCLQYCCLPDDFFTGLITPILKKPHLDPSKPENYRPITVSVTLSKILELYILEECSNFTPHPCQFGFVSHRSTNTAIALAHDVCRYCVSRGSSVYLCSLDAEGAFDCLPHHVLFDKALDVLPPHCWRIMYQWYSRMTAAIKWGGQVSSAMPVQRGTRQGGLTSPLLFNVFYRELIERLDSLSCGVTIKNHHYNCFAYADDVLLASTTPTGLQQLIDEAVRTISSNGLRFNPSKTLCMTYGRSAFTTNPVWTISGTPLAQENSITYLGASLGNDNGKGHVNKRMQAAQKAFYSLQGAGLSFKGLDPRASAHLYSVGVSTILLYGCEAVHIVPASLRQLQVQQGKLIKSFLGLKKFSRTSPLERALYIPSVGDAVGFASLKLFKSILLYPSKASSFYSHLMSMNVGACTFSLYARAFYSGKKCPSQFHKVFVQRPIC